MKFCGYSSVQTTGIEKSFLKLNILQAERTGGEEKEKTVLEDELAWEKYQQSSECLTREGTVDTVVTEFVTSYPTLPFQLYPVLLHTNFIQLPAKIQSL